MANEYYTDTITTAGTTPTVNTFGTLDIGGIGEMSQISFDTPTKIYVWKGSIIYYYEPRDTLSTPFYVRDGERTYYLKTTFEKSYPTFLDTRVEIDLQYLADKLEGEK